VILRENRRSRGVEATTWIDGEIAACQFADVRLGNRLHCLLEQISDAVGESVPMACQDWANTKAAYRFFSNERVNEANILAGHFQATKDRFIGTQGPILVLHDPTEFSFRRESPDKIGITCRVTDVRDMEGRLRLHTVCGILMHSSLALTDTEIRLLDHLVPDKSEPKKKLQVHLPLHHQGCQARRLSRSRQRSRPWKSRHVARNVPPLRY
jgi:hypothetical protein